MKAEFVFWAQESEHSSGIKEGKSAFFVCLREQQSSQGGANNSVTFYCQNSKEGKLTSGAGNLCFPSYCLTDDGSV